MGLVTGLEPMVVLVVETLEVEAALPVDRGACDTLEIGEDDTGVLEAPVPLFDACTGLRCICCTHRPETVRANRNNCSK